MWTLGAWLADAKFGPSAKHTDNQTITKEHTLLGTLQYMSPEQLECKEADARSDIFAFGLVLYEMLSGKCAFEAPSEARLMAAILRQEPPPIDAGPLDRVLRRCLRKDPEERWQNARDVLIELQEAATTTTDSKTHNRLPWIAALAALLVLAVIASTFPSGDRAK